MGAGKGLIKAFSTVKPPAEIRKLDYTKPRPKAKPKRKEWQPPTVDPFNQRWEEILAESELEVKAILAME